MIKKHIAIFRQVSPTMDETKKERLGREVIEDAKEVQDYWRRMARHVWDVEVRGYLMEGVQRCTPPLFARDDITNYINEYGLDGFEPNYFHVHGDFNPNFCGHGQLPGNRSATYLSYGGCGVKTMIHELGHNFGLWHASTRFPNGNTVQYGDNTSIMGSSAVVRGLNSPNRINLKLEDDREIYDIDHTQQVLLAPVELSKHSLHPNQYQHVRIKINREQYHLSMRKMKDRGGFYYNGAAPELVYLHEHNVREKSFREMPDLKPGDEVELTIGAKIKYLEYTDECARLAVYYNKNDPAPPHIEMPTGLSPATVFTPPEEILHNGLWFNGWFDGQGFDIHIRNGKLILYWYTFDQEDDGRRYYIGTADLDGWRSQVPEFELYTTKGGTWEDPTKHESVLAGTAQVTFLEHHIALFKYYTEEHGHGSIELQMAAPSLAAASGVYYDPKRNGEGYSIQFFPENDSLVAYLYSYGPRGDQRWYWIHGFRKETTLGAEAYDLELYEVRDLKWLEFNNNMGDNLHMVGTGTLTVGDKDQLTIDYAIDTGDITGSRVDLVQRLG